MTKTILDQIEDQILESKIVKTISLIYLLGQFDKLKQTSGVDVEQKISDTIAALAPAFSLKSALNASNIDNYLYPAKYNEVLKTTVSLCNNVKMAKAKVEKVVTGVKTVAAFSMGKKVE